MRRNDVKSKLGVLGEIGVAPIAGATGKVLEFERTRIKKRQAVFAECGRPPFPRFQGVVPVTLGKKRNAADKKPILRQMTLNVGEERRDLWRMWMLENLPGS